MNSKRRLEQKPQSIFDYKSLINVFDEAGIKRIHAYNIWHHLVQKNLKDISEIKNIPKIALNIVKNRFTILNSYVVNSHTSEDGSTTKLIFRLQDSHEIETVIMRYGDDNCKENDNMLNKKNRNGSKYRRVSLCVSSQIGCRMGCMFCATGSIGLRGSLLSGEIIQQLYYVRNILGEPVRNVVFMGMGEPLENYEEVIDAIRIMLDPRLFCLSASHILVSTVGIPSNIISIADDLPGIGLCLSLHAPNQALRERIIPIARLYRISDLIRSLDIFIFKTIINRYYKKLMDDRNKHNINETNFNKMLISNKWLNSHNIVVIEYTLIREINDSIKEANELADLLITTPVSKNLLEDLIETRHDQFERYNNYSKNEKLLNIKLKNNLVRIIYKELVKNYNRTNFSLVNLIPYNEISSNREFSTPSDETVKKFALELNKHHIVVTIRKKMGDSIYGACGQLALNKLKDYSIEEINECSKTANIIQSESEMSQSSEIDEFEDMIIKVNSSSNDSGVINSKNFVKGPNSIKILDLLMSFFSRNYRLFKSFLEKNKFSTGFFIGIGLIIHYLFKKYKKT